MTPTQKQIDQWLKDKSDLQPGWTKGIDAKAGFTKDEDGDIVCYDWLTDAGEMDFYRRTAGNLVNYSRPRAQGGNSVTGSSSGSA